MKHVLIYAIFRTEAWWTHVGRNMGVDRVTVLTDTRGRGDWSVTDDFYLSYARLIVSGDRSSSLVTEIEVVDAIARCRVLRSISQPKATAMVLAMAEAMGKALTELQPNAIVSLPIDNYVTDVLERVARARGIPYFELTASALPGMCMLLHRGKLIASEKHPDPAIVSARVAQIANPEFAPLYVQNARKFTRAKFHRIQLYFLLRGMFFQLYAWATRDRLNIRFVDAQPWLAHKAKTSDVRILDIVEHNWREKLLAHSKERRVLFGLQVFPEAAIDYWLDNLELIKHDEMLIKLARNLSNAGYQILVKDHPLQFGFRQVGLLQTLKDIPNVLIVPYEVSGNTMLSLCGVNITATGTLGLQAALLGNISVACEAYYVVDQDFVVIRGWEDLSSIVEQIEHAKSPPPLEERQNRIVSQLLRGSFDGQFMSLFDFDPAAPNDDVTRMGQHLGERLQQLGPDGENWHGRHLRDLSRYRPSLPMRH